MRRITSLIAGLALLLSTSSCSSLPTSLGGILKAVGSLGGDMGGLLGGLDLGSLSESALGPLSGLLGQAGDLSGAMDNLPEGATDKISGLPAFDSLKGALGDVSGFDVKSLLGGGDGAKSALDSLTGSSEQLGSLSKSLLGSLGM